MSSMFSVVIPCYEMKDRGVEFLEFSLSKLNSQSFQDFEIIVSDHSSTDDIQNLCLKFEKLNIKYFRNLQEVGKSSSNLNNCIDRASGKWIKILFQDDFLYSNDSLLKIVEFINYNNCDWIASACEHSYDGKNFYRPFYPKWNNQIHFGNNTISSPSVITFKNRFEENIKFDQSLVNLMDVDFYKRMYDMYGEPHYLNEIIVVNRTWSGQVSNTIVDDELNRKELSIVKSKYRNVDLFFERLVNLQFSHNELYGLGIVDINEHLNTLKRYARKCTHVTEMGTRKAISTIAFLTANPKKVVSIDLNYHLFQPVEQTIRQIAKECETEFQFIEADVLKLEIEETDFLFIDTFHTYHQLLSELRFHSGKVKKWIALHDTVTFGYKDEEVYQNGNISTEVNVNNKQKVGIYNALIDFLQENKNWKIKEHFENNNGLTILERIS